MKKVKLLKTISYRLISSGIGLIVIYLASGSIKAGAIFSIAELIYKPVQYYIHERLWMRYELKKIKEDDITRSQANIHTHTKVCG